jgi:uncharacterized protein (DUF1330 family)
MPAYFLAEIEVENPEMYQQYVERASRVVKRYGGRYVFRSGSIYPVSGDWSPKRMILIEFDSKERILECFSSEEYGKISPLRKRSTKSRAVIVE